jgi:murein DD-endopeptidase MepM/ murein hydrolase activator NlpD
VSFPAAEFAERAAELLAEAPAAVRWQIDVLAPQMLPEGDGYTVRVEFGQNSDGAREHLHSIEILETASGKLVDGAWWVERKAGPSVIVGMKGTAYERALWLSPIAFVRKSRGVGPTSRTVRRNFAAPAPKGATKPGSRVSRIVTLRGFHLGVDLTAPTGTPIHAVGDGVVTFAGRRGGYGNLVIVDHGMGYQTYYAHMSAFQAGVKKGTAVTRGEVIGKVGSTGRSTAPHLHFETRKNSKYIDPYDETRQLDFWMLSAEEHERVALRLLTGSDGAPTVVSAAAGGGGGQ